MNFKQTCPSNPENWVNFSLIISLKNTTGAPLNSQRQVTPFNLPATPAWMQLFRQIVSLHRVYIEK